jgi:hypothetical protein
VGVASYVLLYYFRGTAQPATGRPCVVESNLDPRQATRQMLALKREYGFEPLQVKCDITGQRPGRG